VISDVPWYCWGILANVFIALIEYQNRVGGSSSYLGTLQTTWWMIFVAQCGLFYAWRCAPSMMLAWAAFTLGNTVVRMVSVQWAVHEPPSWATIGGVAVMVLGAFMVKAGSSA
jgi:hypothetical protein